MIDLKQTRLDGVQILERPRASERANAPSESLYDEALYRSCGVAQRFVRDAMDKAGRDELRRLGKRRETWKLVSCLHGKVCLIVVDCRADSAQFREWQSFNLAAGDGLQVLVPSGMDTSLLVLSELAIWHWKESEHISPSQGAWRMPGHRRFQRAGAAANLISLQRARMDAEFPGISMLA